jgi:hypothetical protein
MLPPRLVRTRVSPSTKLILTDPRKMGSSRRSSAEIGQAFWVGASGPTSRTGRRSR